jgi:hypothetical protein
MNVEFTMKPYIVYIKVDSMNRIIDINSSAFISDTEDWLEIDRGYSYNFHHAQNNYFDKYIIDERGIYRYKLENGKVIERTEEEMNEDYIEPEIELTAEERIATLEKENAELKERNMFIEDCIAEMAMLLYA